MPNRDDIYLQSAAKRGWLKLSGTGEPVVTDEAHDRVREIIVGRGLKIHTGVEGRKPKGVVIFEPGRGIESDVLERLEGIAAKTMIEEAWTSRGGPSSPVGLPVDKAISVTKVDGVWTADFRGGQYQLRKHEEKLVPVEITKRVVYINLVGVECQIRQEAEDELYAVLTLVGPADRLIETVQVPAEGTFTLGPDGLRIFNAPANLLAGGTVEDYHVLVTLIEHDSGDAENIARYITDKAKEASAAILQSTTGYGAEAISEDQSELLYYFGLWLVGDLLGMGDDAFNAGGVRITAGELMLPTGPEHQPPVSRADDPRVIESWTHKVVVSGTDDGGDLGQYCFYFDASIEDVRTTVYVPQPHH